MLTLFEESRPSEYLPLSFQLEKLHEGSAATISYAAVHLEFRFRLLEPPLVAYDQANHVP